MRPTMNVMCNTFEQQQMPRQNWVIRCRPGMLCLFFLLLGQVVSAQETFVQDDIRLRSLLGFQLPPVDESELKAFDEFERLISEGDWARALSMLTKMDETQLLTLVRIRNSPVSAPIGIQINKTIISLDPEPLRRYRLFSDPAAREKFDAVCRHPNPGSFEQLTDLQTLLDLFWATSIGGEASELAGDLYFNQGFFRQAEKSWLRAIEHDLTPAARIPELQVRRAIALQSLSDLASIQAIYQGLVGRFDRLPVQLAGEEIEALALLKSMIDQGRDAAEQLPLTKRESGSSLALPESNSKVLWQMPFLTRLDRDEITMVDGDSFVDDLDHYVPEAVADTEKIYFNWMNTAVAVDRQTGKIRWMNGDLRRDIDGFYKRQASTAGNPCNYKIALAGEVLLTTRPVNPEQDKLSRFEVAAIDARGGETLWQSGTRSDWTLAIDIGGSLPLSVIGEVCVYRGAAYVVAHVPLSKFGGDGRCYLCRFDPLTGRIDWTLLLGSCESLRFEYFNSEFLLRMPQPKLLANNGLLHVLIGECKLITVNTSSARIQWALQMDLPYDIKTNGYSPRLDKRIPWEFSDDANPNGSGSLLLHNGLLYAKQHMGRDLFALEPVSGELKLAVQGLPLQAKLVAVDDEHFYTMNRVLTCYKKVDGEPQRVWDSGKTSNLPKHSGVIYKAGQFLTLDGSRLNITSAKTGEVMSVFEDKAHLDPTGGNIYRVDDLIICIGEASITAYRLP